MKFLNHIDESGWISKNNGERQPFVKKVLNFLRKVQKLFPLSHCETPICITELWNESPLLP